ncbi:MAG: hypothetical protein Ct9H300mP21_01300 [Pseudomonadota bacterium]|nr:MAG: hypothetical protein Ct9H300mP21_01300 [Pseudomonadota bacterium]
MKALSKEVDLVLVVGAQNSSNSVRLLEVAETTGVKARRIESAAELGPEWLEEVRNVGITARSIRARGYRAGHSYRNQ